ncbi:MAG TPA: rod shape-determining protein RodA [Flavobacteriales bacterium]|nr:rod shape-determining protein RodA [Flavobacteriales bacterium]
MRSNEVTARKIDWWLVFIYFALTGCGLLNIYSSSYNPEHASFFDQTQEYGKQFMWYCISLGLAGCILLLDGSFIRGMSVTAYFICIAMLILVVLIGTEVNGAKAWFGFGSFGIQPSEFMKVALSLTLAWYLSSQSARSSENRRISAYKRKGVGGLIDRLFSEAHAWTFLIIVVPAALIMLQPDTGTVIVFTGFIFMLYREGLSGNILLYGFFALVIGISTLMVKDSTIDLPFYGAAPGKFMIIFIISIIALVALFLVFNLFLKRARRQAIALVILVWIGSSGIVMGIDYAFQNVLGNHQKERIDIFLGLKEDPDGKGYNIDRAMAAIGSGNFTGKGYMQATLANKNQKHVPMQSTDFIFCTVSEEWGFIGSFTVLCLFMFLLVRLIIIAERQRLAYTRIYAYCVACIFFMHVLINMGMAIGLVPVIGIPLPFFSYGGSSLMAFSILLFILIRLDAERMDVLS